jgi:hypothetical protein
MQQQQVNFVPAAGSCRRSQAVLGFGVGAIVDFVTGSYMPLGLDLQQIRAGALGGRVADIKIFEPRLQYLLETSEFRSVPTPSDKEKRRFGTEVERRFAVPCTRFPEWLECPSCHRLGRVNDPFEVQPNQKVRCTACNVDANPVRFIVCCEQGHINDFPWVRWAHGDQETCKRPLLYLRSAGKSTGLGDLYVECKNRDCKAGPQSLEKIFHKGELRKLGLRCTGRRPWLMTSNQRCDKEPVTVQRGGSNVYFTVTASMLSIPPGSDAVAQFFEQAWDFISALPEGNRDTAVKSYAQVNGIDEELALAWVAERARIARGETVKDEHSARYQEYLALSRNHEAIEVAGARPDFENKVSPPPETISRWFDLIAVAKRVREVRVSCGFTRLAPLPIAIEAIPKALRDGKIVPLSRQKLTWLPAIELRGEGVFLRFKEAEIESWVRRNQGAEARAAQLDGIFQQVCAERGYEPPYPITARLLLVHSFAHALIRRISLDCGYSSASLRERLYVQDSVLGEEPMAGVLIYTGTADSDGSLGGLVAHGSPSRISELVLRTIADVSWCSSDPVCLETEPVVTADRVSGASCHSCLLVPETACEKFNRELDRTFLVGDFGKTYKGFFDGALT